MVGSCNRPVSHCQYVQRTCFIGLMQCFLLPYLQQILPIVLHEAFFYLFSVLSTLSCFFGGGMSPGTITGRWYRPSEVYWSCCWVTQAIMVWLLLIFRGPDHISPTVDVVIYSASVSSWAFIFLDSCRRLSMAAFCLLYIITLKVVLASATFCCLYFEM